MIEIIISVIALIVSIFAYIKAIKKTNLYLVKEGKDFIIKDETGQDIITITKI